MGNMNEIAKMAGVSLGTVSNVLSGSQRVREPLRRRVMEAVEALGYQPSQLARGLRRDKTNMIGMIIPDIMNPFFPGVVRGAEDVAFAGGYRLILCNTDNDPAKEIAHLNELRTYLPSGLLVIPSDTSDLTVQAASYQRSGTALVCVDRIPKDWSGDSVTVSNEAGVYEAVDYAIQLGHTQLAAITGPLRLSISQQRLSGFHRAARMHGLKISPDFIQESSFDQQGGYSMTVRLLRMIPRPTFIFASNDMIAFGVLRALRDAQIDCPNEISVIGFDNLDLAPLSNPSLSSVSQPGYQMGSTAARLMLDRVQGDTSKAKQVVLETALTLRDSVAPPPPSLSKQRTKRIAPGR